MRIAILGAGKVGSTLGRAFTRAGHDVCYAVRDPRDPKHASLGEDGARVLDVKAAVGASDVVVLSTPWAATADALEGAGDLGGRVLIDATNPIGPGLTLTHAHTDSGGEHVARLAQNARVVKCFNTTGIENMADPRYGEHRAAMFVCGDDDEAREVALRLARDIGFEAVSVGGLARARELEPLALLWITLALVLKNGRDVAFGLLHRRGEAATKTTHARTTTPQRIAILGAGHIGEGLARAWAASGHHVVLGVRQPDDEKSRALARALGVSVRALADAAATADVVVLAVPHAAVDDVLRAVAPLTGKVVIDCTNAVAPGMHVAIGGATSSAERLQAKLEGAFVAKSFNAQGAENLADPVYDGVPATNFFCVDDERAREIVRGLVTDVGFDAVSAGPLASARLIEPAMIVWVLASRALGTRDLAFKLLRR